MDFRSALHSVIEKFDKESIQYALIGGFALHFWGYSRATQDLDFIAIGNQKDQIRKSMEQLGFKVYKETENVAHYEKESARIDFIFSRRAHGAKVLQRACDMNFFELKLKVARPEDIIGLKVQSMANNPIRWLREMADIENLVLKNKGNLDLDLIADYFKLFGKEKDWLGILERSNASFK